MWSERLWAKTLVGFFLGLLLSMGIFINIGFALSIPRDVFLMIAVLGSFTVWAALISWFYCVQSIKKPIIMCLIVFSLSSAINAWFYMGSTA
jgi:hypothetical protein